MIDMDTQKKALASDKKLVKVYGADINSFKYSANIYTTNQVYQKKRQKN